MNCQNPNKNMSTNTENKTMVYRLETVNIHLSLQERRCQGGRYLWDQGSHFPRGRVMLSVVQQRLLPHAYPQKGTFCSHWSKGGSDLCDLIWKDLRGTIKDISRFRIECMIFCVWKRQRRRLCVYEPKEHFCFWESRERRIWCDVHTVELIEPKTFTRWSRKW